MPGSCLSRQSRSRWRQCSQFGVQVVTSLACWLGVDSRAPSSIYLVSDSRVTSVDGTRIATQQKVFTSAASPDCFVFSGDVAVPAAVLNRVSRDATTPKTAAGRHCRLVEATSADFGSALSREFEILHASRDGEGIGTRFYLWRTSFAPVSGMNDLPEALPTDSVLALALGSGSAPVLRQDVKWRNSDVGRTSRAVFSAFCDALVSGADPYSGPPPQLAALYRKGNGEDIGVVFGGRCYLRGREISPQDAGAEIVEWRNELFERCDPANGARLKGAQRHARPRQLAGQGALDPARSLSHQRDTST